MKSIKIFIDEKLTLNKQSELNRDVIKLSLIADKLCNDLCIDYTKNDKAKEAIKNWVIDNNVNSYIIIVHNRMLNIIKKLKKNIDSYNIEPSNSTYIDKYNKIMTQARDTNNVLTFDRYHPNLIATTKNNLIYSENGLVFIVEILK